jgi:hypothetical protein
MKRSLVLLAAAAALLAAVSASSHSFAAPTSSTAAHGTELVQLPPAAPAGQQVLWGHIKSLGRKAGRFEMRFDPAWSLNGTAAEHAALEDTGSKDVPNDYYVVEESHRLLTYTVASVAHVTVLDRGLRSIVISVSELAQIVKGKNPKHRALFDRGNHLGFWIRVGTKYPNPVLELDQQYQP